MRDCFFTAIFFKKKTVATFSHSLPFNLDVAVFWDFCKSLEFNLLLSEASSAPNP